MVRWVLIRLLWCLLQIIPADVAIFLLDVFWPTWTDAARKVMRSHSL